MNLSRRQFTGHLVKGATVLAIAGEGIFLGGCNLYNDILNWVPVGEAALNSILTVLTSNGVAISPAIQSIVSLIEAGFTALTAAVKEYQATTPPPVGAIAKIQAAFTAIVDNFGTFLKSINVSSGLVAVVVGIADVVLSTIAGFMNKLPATAAPAIHARSLQVGSQVHVVVPQERTRRAFKKDFNSALDNGVKAGLVVPKSAYLPLSFFEHF